MPKITKKHQKWSPGGFRESSKKTFAQKSRKSDWEQVKNEKVEVQNRTFEFFCEIGTLICRGGRVDRQGRRLQPPPLPPPGELTLLHRAAARAKALRALSGIPTQ